jgi:hypothetical protein
MLRHSPIESSIEVAMAKGQMRSSKEKKKPKAVKDVGAAVQCDLERLVVVIAASFACWRGCLANEN